GIRYREAFGFADLAARRPATTATRFPWFSMSKIVTATAALRLADEGRLDLNAPVAGLAAVGRGDLPRVRQLLDHTAGLPDPVPLRWVRPADTDPAQDRPGLRRVRARRPPGPPARYSNL